MSHPTIPPALSALVADLTASCSSLLSTVSPDHLHDDLPRLEHSLLHILHLLGSHLLSTLVQRLVPSSPPPLVPCPCGASASFLRLRPATTHTLLGLVTIERPVYLCSSCHHGFAPLDLLLGWCAGGRSAALDELLALLGATQDSFAEAADILARLSLVQLAPNTVRDATLTLGQTLADHEHQQTERLQDHHLPDPSPASATNVLCISLDGVHAPIRPDGWKEVCVGAVYEVDACETRASARADAVHAQSISYVADLGSEREAFGWQLYGEVVRRGGLQRELVVVGDGAAWIWSLAELHFPQATCILDWFHATQYIWRAAEGRRLAYAQEQAAWAEQQIALLWDGKVGEVIAEMEQHAEEGEAMAEAARSFRNQQGRMEYPRYRARGMPIGSGTIESGCKQVVSVRLKGAGMRWSAEGARGVVKVRAWVKGGRWEEAMALRAAPCRRRHRRGKMPSQMQTHCEAAKRAAVEQGETQVSVSADVVALVRAEMRQKPLRHPWKTAWSHNQQRTISV